MVCIIDTCEIIRITGKKLLIKREKQGLNLNRGSYRIREVEDLRKRVERTKCGRILIRNDKIGKGKKIIPI